MKMKKSLIAILLSLVFVCTNYIGIFAAEPVSSGGVISIDAQEGVPETGKPWKNYLAQIRCVL